MPENGSAGNPLGEGKDMEHSDETLQATGLYCAAAASVTGTYAVGAAAAGMKGLYIVEGMDYEPTGQLHFAWRLVVSSKLRASD
jgi:methyl coenzyme M reductase alpha subunit